MDPGSPLRHHDAPTIIHGPSIITTDAPACFPGVPDPEPGIRVVAPGVSMAEPAVPRSELDTFGSQHDVPSVTGDPPGEKCGAPSPASIASVRRSDGPPSDCDAPPMHTGESARITRQPGNGSRRRSPCRILRR